MLKIPFNFREKQRRSNWIIAKQLVRLTNDPLSHWLPDLCTAEPFQCFPSSYLLPFSISGEIAREYSPGRTSDEIQVYPAVTRFRNRRAPCVSPIIYSAFNGNLASSHLWPRNLLDYTGQTFRGSVPDFSVIKGHRASDTFQMTFRLAR